MTIRQMETFLTVVEEKSFVRAAEKLFLTQPAITQQIKSLETEIGTPLLIRDPHHFALTPAGETFCRGARSILTQYHQTMQDCLYASSEQEELHISCVGLSDIWVLPNLILAFRSRFPKCTVVPDHVSPYQVESALNSRQTDFVLAPKSVLSEIPDASSLSFHLLYEDRYYCCMPAAHPLAARDSLTLEDLDGETLLGPPPKGRSSHMVRLYQDLTAVSPHIRTIDGMTITNTTIQLLTMNAIALLPGFSRPSHRNLVAVPLQHDIRIPFGLITLKSCSALQAEWIRTAQNCYIPS